MFSARGTGHCAVFLIIFVVLFNSVTLDAKRWGSSSSSSSRGSTWGRGSGGRVSKPAPRPPVYMPKPQPRPVYVPKPAPPPKAPSPPLQRPSIPPHTGTLNGKDGSQGLINSEGRPRPGGTGSIVNDQKQKSTPHQPTAPMEPINKVTVGNVQNQANPHGTAPGGSYPVWANPGAAPHGGANPHAPGGGFPNGPGYPLQNKPAGPIVPPHPPIHPPGPISHTPINPVGAPHGTNLYPNTPHGMQAPFPPAPQYPLGHPPGMPMPNAPHIGWGNGGHAGGVHQPMGSPHIYPPMGSSPMQPHMAGAPPTVINNHYHAPVGAPHMQQPVYGGAPMSQPFVPGQTTIFLPSQQSSGPGIGQLVKEALVFSTVNAGVNRLINGAPHHHDHYIPAPAAAPAAPAGSGSTPPAVTNTVIYNNYGPQNPGDNSAAPGSGAATFPGTPPIPGAAPVPGVAPVPGTPPVSGVAPAVQPGSQPPFPGTPPNGNTNFPAGNAGLNPATPPVGATTTDQTNVQPGNTGQTGQVHPIGVTVTNTTAEAAPPVVQYYISNEELWNLTELLFTKDEFNASKYLTLNLQNRLVDPNATDVAPAPLLYVTWEAYSIPTIKILREIYDNYEFDSNKKESINEETRSKENILLDVFLGTDVMTTTLTWLSQKGYIEPDSFEWKDTMRHIWMSKVNGATSGFERIFLAERYDGPSILGGQNWVYFENQESKKRINYMGYVDSIDLGRKSHLVKVHFKIDDAVKPNSTMLIGTPPELEMALYTICYYARPNDVCNVSLGGVKFNIYSHMFRYFGKDLIDLGLMFF